MDTMTPPTPPAPELNHKQLKAMAKASRPWYLKKRFWALGVVGIIIVAAAAGSGSSSDGGSTSTKQNGGVSGVESNNSGSHAAADDVDITKCESQDLAGTIFPEVEVTINNHTSKRSNYLVEIAIMDGSTKVGDGTAVSNNVEAGGEAVESALATATRDFTTCKVVSVSRYAS